MSEQDPRNTLLMEKRNRVLKGGGADRIAKQHAKGKMTARERLQALLDPGTFQELQPFIITRGSDEIPGDGVITGYGLIDGRRVFVYAQDFTVQGGSVSLRHAERICRVLDLAMSSGAPVIGLLDSGGARIQEGVKALHGYGEIFKRNALASGVIPQISVMLGPCAGGASYSPALTDFIIMSEQNSFMFITGPEVVKSVTGETVTAEALGGAAVHYTVSGVAHFIGETEQNALTIVRLLLSYLPSNNVEEPPCITPTDDPLRTDPHLNSLVPLDPKVPYDMKEVITSVMDLGSFLEVQAGWAQNAIIGLARLDGRPVGVVAQQPMHLGGAIDINAADKIARFVRFCDAFNLPIITFCDSPGFLPGVAQEHGGIIRHGAKILYAYINSTVPKISIVTRKAYGGAYLVMSSKSIGADLHFAWPSAEIAVMGPEGAVNILYRKELAEAEDPAALRAQLVKDYIARYATPYVAAEEGILDDVIEPAHTRPILINALNMLQEMQRVLPSKKHGIMPV